MKKGKRTIALAAALFVFSSQASFGSAASVMGITPSFGLQTAFADDGYVGVPGHWADKYLENLYNRGIMRGDIWGNLDPDKAITRAEFVSLINRTFGYTELPEDEIEYEDVTVDDWFYNDLQIAANQGYFSGITENIADPYGRLTREQAVSLICRNIKIPESKGEGFKFTDSRTFNGWSRGYINAAGEKGIVNGYTDGTFRPTNVITRGEAAKVLSDVGGEIMAASGDYFFNRIEGNATVSAANVTLRDTVITGDLYITAGVGLGQVKFYNVQVLGEVYISGAGESEYGDSSVLFSDSSIPALIIDVSNDKICSVKIEGSTNVKTTNVKSDAYLEELTDNDGGFDKVIMDGSDGAVLNLGGSFNEVTVKGLNNELELGKGSIETLTADEHAGEAKFYLDQDTYVRNLILDTATNVSGDGDVSRAVISANDCVVTMLPDEIEIRPAVTASIYNEQMKTADGEIASNRPRILGRYPELEDIGPTAVTALFETNKPGTIYWGISTEEYGALSEEELLKPPVNKKNESIIQTGNFVTEGNKEESLNISGMKANEEYVLSALLQDNREDNSPKKRVFFTMSDDTLPDFLSGYPKVVETDNTSVTVGIIPTKNCSFYWAVFPTGSVQPEKKDLRTQDNPGKVAQGKTTGGKKNIQKDISISGLEEMKTYDLYIMLSDGENESDIEKLTFTTADKTPPKFMEGYPKNDKISPSSVDVRYNVNENGTIYYVVCKRGEVFPPIVPPATSPPDINSEDGKLAIVTGNNALLKGQASVNEFDINTFAVGGLEEETPYDLYMLIEDAAGNQSDVTKLQIKTTDTVVPTVEQEFSSVINDNVASDSVISLIFSEIVCDAITGKDLTEFTGSVDLINNISIYDMSQAKRTQVDIDFTNVTVELVDGKTVVAIPPGAINLESGSYYEFELNKIVDTSANKMQDQTVLPRFRMVAPRVELVKTETPNNMDLTFQQLFQSKNTSDNLLFDSVISSNTTISFDLYVKDADDKNFPIQPLKTGCYLPADEPLTIRYFLDKQRDDSTGESDTGGDYQFEQFNELYDREYGIVITEVEKNSDRASWSKTIKIGVQCVVGSRTNLSTIAASPKNNLDNVVENEGGAFVHYPDEFTLSVSFTDTKIPKFIGPGDDLKPKYTSSDTYIDAQMMTDRKATVYFVIGQKNDFGETPSAFDIMNGAVYPAHGYCGSIEIPGGQVVQNFRFSNLLPGVGNNNQEYYIFYVLKGTPAEPSEVIRQSAYTTRVKPPVITNREVVKVDEKSATISMTVDSDATVYWVMYPETDIALYKMNNPNFEVDGDFVKEHVEKPDLKPIDFGTSNAVQDVPFEIIGNNLERDVYYVLYAVAIKPVGGGYSAVAEITSLTAKDVTPPTVEVGTSDETRFLTDPTVPYKGTATLIFSEPLYIVPSDGGDPEKLTETMLRQYYMNGVDGISISRVSESDGAVKEVTFTYENIYSGRSFSFYIERIYDANKNLAGTLSLRFQAGRNREDAQWVAEFNKGN